MCACQHGNVQSILLQVRAKTFYAEKKGLNVADVDVPVIGGHAGITILPLFSQASPHAQLSDEETDQLTKRTQDGGTEVVAAKAGKVQSVLPSPIAYPAAPENGVCMLLDVFLAFVNCCFSGVSSCACPTTNV